MEDSTAPQGSFPSGRSTVSGNWRAKDDAPRPDGQPAYRPQRSFGQGNAGGAAEGGNSDTRLYVGNLLYTAQRPDVEAFFVDNGFPISGISMSMDPMTGRNKSYAFVDFETAEDATRAMNELTGQELLGRAVKINPGMRREAGSTGYQSRPQGQGQYDGQRGGFGGRGGYGGDRGGYGGDRGGYGGQAGGRQDYGSNGYSQGAGGYGREQNTPRPENPTRLYVGNLPNIEPQEALEAEIANLFAGFQFKTVSRLIAPHESKADEPGNHHYCFVDFETPEEADQVLDAYAGKESPWGGQLRINKARDNRQKRQYGGERQGPYTRPSGGERSMGGGAWR